MINKIYEKIKSFIIENYLFLLFYIVLVALLVYKLPYYIYTGGGTISVNDKIAVENETVSKGSFNMCYVSQINATIPSYLLSYVISSWDVIPQEEILLNDKETNTDLVIRDKIYLEQANQDALITALNASNTNYQITKSHTYIIYIDEDSNTNLKVGDEVIEIEGKTITNTQDISEILVNKNIGDKINITVINDNKKENKYAYVTKEDNRKIIGIAIETIHDIETETDIDFHFSKSESGPSGGLILSLALYDKLVDEDITKGLKIAGTGTIDSNGNVGTIGGVKYKLNGAVKSKADVFLVPNGENYEECIKLKKKHNYNIKIIGVDTFEEAVKELSELKAKNND